MATGTHPPSPDGGPQPALDGSASISTDRAANAIALVAVAGVLVAGAVLGRNLWFFSDEWNIFSSYSNGNLFEPFNSHLSLVPAGAFHVLFRTVGVSSYLPYRLLGLACYALMAAMVWRYARDRVGPMTGALACTWVAWGSGGVTNLMLPFLLNFSVPIAATAAVFWHLDRRGPRSDRWASVWLALALATSGLGLMLAAAVAVELAWTRSHWRRWVIFGPGPLAWFVWYLIWGVDSPPNNGVGQMTSYALQMLWGGVVALGANSPVGAGFVALGLAAVLGRAWRDGQIERARLVSAWSMPLVFAALTAWSRTGVLPRIPPDELRYRWTIAAFVVLAVVSSLPSERTWTIRRSAQLVLAVTGFLVLAGAIPLLRDSTRWAETVADARPGLEAVTFATEAGGDAVTADRVIPLSFVPVRAGEYLDAVDAVGSPLTSIDLTGWAGRADQRLAADEILADGTTITSESTSDERCRGLRADTLIAPGTVFRVDGPGGSLSLRRFLLDSDVEAPRIDLPSGPVRLQLPPDPPSGSGSRPYRLEFPPGADVLEC